METQFSLPSVSQETATPKKHSSPLSRRAATCTPALGTTETLLSLKDGATSTTQAPHSATTAPPWLGRGRPVAITHPFATMSGECAAADHYTHCEDATSGSNNVLRNKTPVSGTPRALMDPANDTSSDIRDRWNGEAVSRIPSNDFAITATNCGIKTTPTYSCKSHGVAARTSTALSGGSSFNSLSASNPQTEKCGSGTATPATSWRADGPLDRVDSMKGCREGKNVQDEKAQRTWPKRVSRQGDEAVDSLRHVVRDLWSACTLSELCAENSKIAVVDSRLPISTVIKSLIEYKKPWVVVFCEESGSFVGCFTAQELIVYLGHAWSLMADSLYRDRFMSIVSMHTISPDIQFVPFPEVDHVLPDVITPDQECLFSSHGISRHPADHGSHSSCTWGTEPAVVAADTGDPTCCATHTTGAPCGHANELSSLGALYNKKVAQTDVPWDVAAWVVQDPASVLVPLPDWFSVALLDTPGLTQKSFRRLRGLLKKEKIKQENENRKAVEGNATNIRLVEDPCAAQTELQEKAHSETKDATGCVVLHWPPPWMYTLDFWRRIAGVNASSSLLGVHPDQSPIEAVLLLLQTRVPQLAIWNDDRSCPLHFVSLYSMLHHLVQHVRI